ncbi:MAG: hypothetical protein Q7J98_04780 [Kiritimatiellia bacterium]|nr:hypothetical protein [Kiritimatiellia bacterium]
MTKKRSSLVMRSVRFGAPVIPGSTGNPVAIRANDIYKRVRKSE